MANAVYTAPILTGRRLSSEQVVAIQREKILAGAIDALDAIGYERVTVAAIISRARVSRGAFYDQFADRDECFAAVIDDGVARLEAKLAAAGVHGLGWQQQVEAGVAVILEFLDRHRALARSLFVESHRAGPELQRRRTVVLARLAAFLERGDVEAGARVIEVPAQALVGAACEIVHRRLLHDYGEPLLPIAEELASTLLIAYREETPADTRRSRRRRAPRRLAAAA